MVAATGRFWYHNAIKRKGAKHNDDDLSGPDGSGRGGDGAAGNGGVGVMQMSLILTLVAIPLTLAVAAAIVYLVYLLIRALRKYLRSGEVRQENREAVESLAKALKSHRERCRMTQEFVAEAVGVSRQAVSKWETGAADPSTANLLALAKLYGVSAEELLRGTRGDAE